MSKPNIYNVIATGTTEPRDIRDRFSDVIDVKDFGAKGDGVTDDTEALKAAIVIATEKGARLFFPYGIYIVSKNVPSFHESAPFGDGVIISNGTTFRLSLKERYLNTLYVSPTGEDSNDGLSQNTPFRTLQRAFDVWKSVYSNYGCNLKIILANGTYTDGATLDTCASSGILYVEGESKTGTVIDGTSATKNAGITFNLCSIVSVKNVTAKNFTYGGIVQSNGKAIFIENCDAFNNGYADINSTGSIKLTMSGSCSVGNGTRFGIRLYQNMEASIGRTESDVISVTGCTEGGLYIRDFSKAVCGGTLSLLQNAYGLELVKGSYCELRTAEVANNTIAGIYADTLSIFDHINGTLNIHDNPINKQFWGFSQDRSVFTTSRVNIPAWITGHLGVSGISPKSLFDLVIDSIGSTGLQFLTGDDDSAYIGRKTSVGETHNIRLRTSQYVFMLDNENANVLTKAYLCSGFDNIQALGRASERFTQVYAASGSINTSDAREKVNLSDPTEAIMRAWSKINFKSFQFIDAVEKKGPEEARIHFGVIAQQVKEAFESEGLDASRYALFCYDKWDDEYEDVEVIDTEATYDENGNELTPQISHIEKRLVTPAGDRYGIRYSEALALEAAYQRWLGEQRDKEIAELKAMLANSKEEKTKN